MSKKSLFFLVAGALLLIGAAGFWYYRDTVFSRQVLKIDILGSDTAAMGQEIQYTVKYKNNGNFALENPVLVFQLPDHALTEDGKTMFTQDIKDIYPGDEETVSFKARLLGKEGDIETARATLSYTPHNLSVRYESDTSFVTKIDSVPLTMTYDLPSKVEKGKDISYAVNYFSNLDYPLGNLSIKLDPVNGFSFESAIPSSLDNVEWKLGTLNQTQGGRITVKGTVTADPGSTVTFAAHLGMWVNGSFIIMKDVTQDVQVIQPQLYIDQQINGQSDYVASPGETLRYDLFFRNIGTTPFDNLFVIARLDGSAFDLSTLTSSDGQAQANDNLIVFDPKQLANLNNVQPNQEAKVSFEVKLKNSWTSADSNKNNTLIKDKIQVSDISQEFDTKVNSELQVLQAATHASGNGIDNTGSLPPQVDQATTYTVTWQLKNYFNDVKNVKVKATLPQGVTLTARLAPDSQIANFSLDSTSREIVWSVGDMAAGTGVTSAAPSISFQISFTPNLPQKGAAAGLIGQATATGDDQYTGKTVQGTAPAVDTAGVDGVGTSGGMVQ